MAWQKQVDKVAEAGNDDICLRFYVGDVGGLRCTVRIDTDHGKEVTDLDVSEHVTTEEHADLIAVLKKVRDAGLVALGYSESE